MVLLAGGKPLRLMPSKPLPVQGLHGLILGGGADIDPARYNESVIKSIRRESRRVRHINFDFITSILLWLLRRISAATAPSLSADVARDEMEFNLLAKAIERGIPILGICRGSQLINVFSGGSLFQEIKDFYVEFPNLHSIRARKIIHIDPGTSLSRILETTHSKVNSLHHQSVKHLGKDLRISACESNGIVQAIEHRTYPFLVGVQWHPEFLPLRREQRRIFHYLVVASRAWKIAPPHSRQ